MQFGLRLKNKNVITAEQLVAALEVQMRSLVPIGQLALEEGMLSARDIFEILFAQSRSPSERFGDLAIERGLLTRDDVMWLLMLQADRKRPIGEILVGQGVLSEQRLAAEMADYRQAMLGPETAPATVAPPSRTRNVERTMSAALHL